MYDDGVRAMIDQSMAAAYIGWFRERLRDIVLCCGVGITNLCFASDASERCVEDSGLKIGINVIALNQDAIKYKLSMENVSLDRIEVNKKTVPWLNPGWVSVVLLDWRSGGSFEQWVLQSRLKFSIGGLDQRRGVFFSKYVRELIDSVNGVLIPGQSLTSNAELSVSLSNTQLARADLERLRQEGVFLWTARLRVHNVDCLQSGITVVE